MNEALPKLLRAIAGGTDAKAAGHDVILNLAADELEQLREFYRLATRPTKHTLHPDHFHKDPAWDI